MIIVSATRRWILNGRGAMRRSVTNTEMSSPETGPGERGGEGEAGQPCTCQMTLVAPLDGDLVQYSAV